MTMYNKSDFWHLGFTIEWPECTRSRHLFNVAERQECTDTVEELMFCQISILICILRFILYSRHDRVSIYTLKHGMDCMGGSVT